MDFAIEKTGELDIKLTITIPAAEVDQRFEEKLTETASKVSLKGFRPGKAPLSVVKMKFSKEVRAEVVSELIQQALEKALEQEKLTPAHRPNLEQLDDNPGEPLRAIIQFECMPEVPAVDLKDISVTQKEGSVTEIDVDAMLEKLREQNAKHKPVDRPAAKGDVVKIDFVGKLADGAEIPRGSANDYECHLGKGEMIPGFEEGLMGVKTGEKRVLNVTFPEQYGEKSLAGRAAEFDVTVNEVAELELPELNDQFAVELGIKEGGLAALRTKVSENLQNAQQEKLKYINKQTVLEALYQKYPLVLPNALVDEEIKEMRAQLKQKAHEHDHDHVHDEHCNHDHDHEEVLDGFSPDYFEKEAKKRITLGLLLHKLIRDNNIEPDAERVKAAVHQAVSAFGGDPNVFAQYYYSNEQLMTRLRTSVVEEMALERLLADASIQKQQLSHEEIMNFAEKE